MNTPITNSTDAVCNPLDTLVDMLTTMRPMGSRQERKFRNRWLLNLPGMVADRFGNLHCIVPLANGDPSHVLWSCHTDTVHRRSGRQLLFVGKERISLSYKEKVANCLGADDTVGCWLMREMILAKVPGHYVFHWGEERGGIGSRNVTLHEPDRFDHLHYAIAFDRRGTTDVITHQGWGRCCSDKFAESLATILQGVADYKPSSGGIYTDTAEYTGLIGECTNISVGYYSEHTQMESVDHRHTLRLLAAMLRFDESQLAYERNPGDEETWDTYDADDWKIRWEIKSHDRDSYDGFGGFSKDQREDIAYQMGMDVDDISQTDWEQLATLSERELAEYGVVLDPADYEDDTLPVIKQKLKEWMH